MSRPWPDPDEPKFIDARLEFAALLVVAALSIVALFLM